MTLHRPAALAALIATGLLLSACHKPPEAPANEANVTTPLPETPPPAHVANEAQPAPATKETAVAPPDNYQLSDDEQIREDAEATGMTSHTHAGEAGAGNTQR
jgi:hypothetical protein